MLGCGVEDLAGGVGVADRGVLVDAEHGGQVEWVGAVDEGFLELPIDVEPFEGGGQSPEGAGDPDSADWPGFQRGESVDEQVRVGGAAIGFGVRRAIRGSRRE